MSRGSKFTRGPWRVDEDDLGYPVVVTYAGVLVTAPENSDDEDADMRLIASAPELYEACWKVLQAYRTDWNAMTAEEKKLANDFADDDELIVKTLRAALRKADGGTDDSK